MQNTLNTDTNWEIVCQLHFPSNSVLGFLPGLVSILCLTCLISLPLHSAEEQTLLCQLPVSCWFGLALKAVKGNLILNT